MSISFFSWLLPIRNKVLSLVSCCYGYPLFSGCILSILSSVYLIKDYAVANRSVLPLLWQIEHSKQVQKEPLGLMIKALSDFFEIEPLWAGYFLMVICHAVLIVLLLAIAKLLFFSKMTRWSLILLLLSHPSYNDFRTYIIIDPVFWCCWLFAIYILLGWYKQKTVLVIVLWFLLFLLSTYFTVAAWFWLLLFPFGALFFKPWRRKSVAYALLGYALIVTVLLFLPVYKGDSPLQWVIVTILDNPNSLADILGLNESNWIKEENTFMAGVFVFSGAMSLVLVRSFIAMGIVCSSLAIYALLRKQHRIIDGERLRIFAYVIGFGLFISVILFLLEKDTGSLISFSVALLLFLFSALGLSYVFKKIEAKRYSRLSVLVIVWCLVAYLASGFIIFGPRKDYLLDAADFGKNLKSLPLYSNEQLFLFYAGENPIHAREWNEFKMIDKVGEYYFAYEKNRNQALPIELEKQTPLETFANQRGDKLLIYRLSALEHRAN